MPNFTCDTSYIITYSIRDIPSHFYLSDIVLLELMRSASDKSTFDKYKTYRDISIVKEKLITPNEDDWQNASKALFWLEQEVRRENKGVAPPKKKGVTQRMALDALIALSARRANVTVVTENVSDFEAIQYYFSSLKIISGSDYNNRYL